MFGPAETTARRDNHNHSHSDEYEYSIRPAQADDLPYLPAIERSASSAFLTVTPSDTDLALIADDEPISVESHGEHIKDWTSHPVIREIENSNGAGNGVGTGTGTWVAVAVPKVPPISSGDGKQTERTVVGFIVTSLLEVYHDEVQDEAGDTDSRQQERRMGLYFVHIHELSVHIAHQRRGVARRLIQAVRDCAGQIDSVYRDSWSAGREIGERDRVKILGLSLTTFRDVAFNAPFYKKLGFEVLEVEELKEVTGEDGLFVWNEEQERFGGIGDGRLAHRRCWMICCLGD